MNTTGTLRSIMGRPDEQKTYKNAEEYSNYIKTLNKARLQDLCMDAGLVPAHDRRMMIRALEKQYKRNDAKNVRVMDLDKLSQHKKAKTK